MRSPLAAMRCESPVNKLSVSPTNIIAVPLDNRNVLLFDLNGLKLARLPRSNRMVRTKPFFFIFFFYFYFYFYFFYFLFFFFFIFFLFKFWNNLFESNFIFRGIVEWFVPLRGWRLRTPIRAAISSLADSIGCFMDGTSSRTKNTKTKPRCLGHLIDSSPFHVLFAYSIEKKRRIVLCHLTFGQCPARWPFRTMNSIARKI